MKISSVVAVAFICLFNFFYCSGKETERVFVHPLTNMPGTSEDVDTSFYFPAHPDQKFPIGETVTVLCHFSNDGDNALNVTAIMGSLNFLYDFRHHIQNYTYKPFGIVVKGGEEVTLQYQFQVHPELEPIEYMLAHTVFYESEREAFSTTFFNETVELYSSNSDYDIATVGQLLVSFLFTIALALGVFYVCAPEKSSEILGRTVAAAGRKSSANTWDDDVVVLQKSTKKTKRS